MKTLAEVTLEVLEQIKITIADPETKFYCFSGICEMFRIKQKQMLMLETDNEYICLRSSILTLGYIMPILGIDWCNWDKFSGHNAYPIPHPKHEANVGYHVVTRDKYWDLETEYGRNRMELLEWLIEQVKEKIDVS